VACVGIPAVGHGRRRMALRVLDVGQVEVLRIVVHIYSRLAK
jgi:hypothetical protein